MNGMVDWDVIGCAVTEPHEHATVEHVVDLSVRHGYLDYPPIPHHLVPSPFTMEIWDPARSAEFDPEGPWCPARDIVSGVIRDLVCWEPPETLIMLDLFSRAQQAGYEWTFYDIGAQLGWYSMLALLYGHEVVAYEADTDVAKVLDRNLERVDPERGLFHLRVKRIGPNLPPVKEVGPIIAKVDVEGAEPDAMRILSSCDVRAALIELSPTFDVDVDQLIFDTMVNHGLDAYFMPDKSVPPAEVEGIDDLVRVENPYDVMKMVAKHHQTNVLFANMREL